MRGHGAVLYVSFPGLQAASFANLRGQIAEVEAKLRDSGLVLLGPPAQYALPEEYMFNTRTTSTSRAPIFRTRLLIADLRGRL